MSVNLADIGGFRIVAVTGIRHCGRPVRMNVRVVTMPKGRIIVYMDFDNRNSRASDSHGHHGKHELAGTHAGCRQIGHSAGKVPDSIQRIKHLAHTSAGIPGSATT